MCALLGGKAMRVWLGKSCARNSYREKIYTKKPYSFYTVQYSSTRYSTVLYHIEVVLYHVETVRYSKAVSKAVRDLWKLWEFEKEFAVVESLTAKNTRLILTACEVKVRVPAGRVWLELKISFMRVLRVENCRTRISHKEKMCSTVCNSYKG